MKYTLLLTVFFCLFIFGSCAPGEIVERLSHHEKTEEGVITALTPEPVLEKEDTNDSNMVLESGNYWTAGIPGFGENALSAFTGEYRIPGITGTVKVWLTMEFIYYDGWNNRNSITSIAVYEKMGYEGLIAASTLQNNWTAAMLFPLGSGLSRQDEDRIILYLIDKFSGFSGQGQNISFPAFITY